MQHTKRRGFETFMIFSRKPAKHYFIDSENVNDVWVAGIVQGLGLKDHIYIFYSENSTHMKSDSVRSLVELGSDRVTWIRCFIGTNALDFQLVTVLGAVASNGRSEDEYIIVSNDAGFDAVVQFWQEQGREVSRLKMDTSAGKPKRRSKARKPVRKFQSQTPDIKPEQKQAQTQIQPQQPQQSQQQQQQPEQQKKQQPKTEQQKKQQSKAEQPKKQQQQKGEQPKKQQQQKGEQSKKQQQKGEQSKKQQQKDEQPKKQQQPKVEKKQEQPKQQNKVVQELNKRDQIILKSVCRSIPSRDAGQLHDALNTLLGAEDGMRIYNYLKGHPDEQQRLESVLLKESESRAANYVRLIYAVAGVSEDVGLTITKIYSDSRKDGLQGINLNMVKTFGQEDATKYYPDLKRHYRILEKINKN